MTKAKLETRYRALSNIEHPLREYPLEETDNLGRKHRRIVRVTVEAGEDVDLSHRKEDRINDLIAAGVVEPYSVPKGTPHVVHRMPLREVYDHAKSTWVEIRPYTPAQYQWGVYDETKRTMVYWDADFSIWLGETEFIEAYVAPQGDSI